MKIFNPTNNADYNVIPVGATQPVLSLLKDGCPNKIVGANGYSPQTRTQSDSSKEGFAT
jgi:hypothetical protein